MSLIEDKVVSMQFDNSRFNPEIEKSQKALDKLEKSIKTKDYDGAFNPLIAALSKASDSFSRLEVIGLGVLSNLATKAIDAGAQMVKSLTIDPALEGWDKYETKTSSIQTIIAATGKSMAEVETQMEKLSWFTDETSYSLSDMTNNIGKFTASGVDLEKAVTAMIGISDLAAVSGQRAGEAARVMYNSAQALSLGYMSQMDWKSIENANMATMEFKKILVDTAVQMGTLKQIADDSFVAVDKQTGKMLDETKHAFNVAGMRNQLSDQWLTNDVYIAALENYGKFSEKVYELYKEVNEALDGNKLTTEILSDIKEFGKVSDEELKELGYSSEEAITLFRDLSEQVEGLGYKAFKAAQETKTFSDMIDALKDATTTAWSKVYETIFGNYEESKVFWSDIVEQLYDMAVVPIQNITDRLQEWKDLGGRDDFLDGIKNSIQVVQNLIDMVSSSVRSMFPKKTDKELVAITEKFKMISEAIMMMTGSAMDASEEITETVDGVTTVIGTNWEVIRQKSIFKKIKATFDGIVGVFKIFSSAVSGFASAAYRFDAAVQVIIDAVLDAAESIGNWINSLKDALDYNNTFYQIFDGIAEIIEELGLTIRDAFRFIQDLFQNFLDTIGVQSKQLGDNFAWVSKFTDRFTKKLKLFAGVLRAFRTGDLQDVFSKTLEQFNEEQFQEDLKYTINKLKNFVGNIGPKVKAIISKIASGIQFIVSSLKTLYTKYKISERIESIRIKLTELFSFITGKVGGFNLKQKIKDAYTTVSKFIADTKDKIDSLDLKAKLKDTFDKVAKFIGDIKTKLASINLKEILKNTIGDAIGLFKMVKSTLAGINFKAMLEKILDAIVPIYNWLQKIKSKINIEKLLTNVVEIIQLLAEHAFKLVKKVDFAGIIADIINAITTLSSRVKELLKNYDVAGIVASWISLARQLFNIIVNAASSSDILGIIAKGISAVTSAANKLASALGKVNISGIASRVGTVLKKLIDIASTAFQKLDIASLFKNISDVAVWALNQIISAMNRIDFARILGKLGNLIGKVFAKFADFATRADIVNILEYAAIAFEHLLDILTELIDKVDIDQLTTNIERGLGKIVEFLNKIKNDEPLKSIFADLKEDFGEIKRIVGELFNVIGSFFSSTWNVLANNGKAAESINETATFAEKLSSALKWLKDILKDINLIQYSDAAEAMGTGFGNALVAIKNFAIKAWDFIGKVKDKVLEIKDLFSDLLTTKDFEKFKSTLSEIDIPKILGTAIEFVGKLISKLDVVKDKFVESGFMDDIRGYFDDFKDRLTGKWDVSGTLGAISDGFIWLGSAISWFIHNVGTNVGKFIVDIFKAIKETFSKSDKESSAAVDLLKNIGRTISIISYTIMYIFGIIGLLMEKIFNFVKDHNLGELAAVALAIAVIFSLVQIIFKLGKGFKALSKSMTYLSNAIGGIGGGLSSIGGGIKGGLSGISDFFKTKSGINITTIIASVAKSLLMIAGAITLLGFACDRLSVPAMITAATIIAAFTVALVLIAKNLSHLSLMYAKKLGKDGGKDMKNVLSGMAMVMLAVTASALIIALAIAKLAEVYDTFSPGASIAATTAVALIAGAMMFILNKLASTSNSIDKNALSTMGKMITLALSMAKVIKVIAKAIRSIVSAKDATWDRIAAAGGALTLVMGVLVGLFSAMMKLSEKVDFSKILSIAGAMIAMGIATSAIGVALGAIVGVISNSEYSEGSLLKAIGALAGILVAMGVVIAVMGAFGKNSGAMIVGALAFAVLSASMLILVQALKGMSEVIVLAQKSGIDNFNKRVITPLLAIMYGLGAVVAAFALIAHSGIALAGIAVGILALGAAIAGIYALSKFLPEFADAITYLTTKVSGSELLALCGPLAVFGAVILEFGVVAAILGVLSPLLGAFAAVMILFAFSLESMTAAIDGFMNLDLGDLDNKTESLKKLFIFLGLSSAVLALISPLLIIAGIGLGIFAAACWIASKALETTAKAFKMFAEIGKKSMADAVNAVQVGIYGIIQTFFGAGVEILQGIQLFGAELIETITVLYLALLDAVDQVIPRWAQHIVKVVTTICEVALELAPLLAETVVTIVDEILQALADHSESILDSLITIFGAIFRRFRDWFHSLDIPGKLETWAKDTATKLVNPAKIALLNIVKAGRDLKYKWKTGTRELLLWMMEKVEDAVNTIVENSPQFLKDWLKIEDDFRADFTSGIRDTISDLEAEKKALDDATDATIQELESEMELVKWREKHAKSDPLTLGSQDYLWNPVTEDEEGGIKRSEEAIKAATKEGITEGVQEGIDAANKTSVFDGLLDGIKSSLNLGGNNANGGGLGELLSGMLGNLLGGKDGLDLSSIIGGISGGSGLNLQNMFNLGDIDLQNAFGNTGFDMGELFSGDFISGMNVGVDSYLDNISGSDIESSIGEVGTQIGSAFSLDFMSGFDSGIDITNFTSKFNDAIGGINDDIDGIEDPTLSLVVDDQSLDDLTNRLNNMDYELDLSNSTNAAQAVSRSESTSDLMDFANQQQNNNPNYSYTQNIYTSSIDRIGVYRDTKSLLGRTATGGAY